jgi:hypothetical protein
VAGRVWRARMTRLLAAAMVGLVGFPGLGAPRAAVARAPEAPPTTNQAEADALAAARHSGVPVEVAGSKSEVSRVIASPQGSLVYEQYPVPRWTRGRDNAWRQIDTALRVGNGAVAPVATLADVRFSAGGSGPLVTVGVGGGEVRMSWPSSLPTPRLRDNAAVYESVMSGVDLEVRALVDGFSWVLVVHSAQAAANPGLASLRMGLAASGLTLRNRAGGGFEAIDPAGASVLSAGQALMWDSAGVPAAARSARLTTNKGEPDHRTVPDGSTTAPVPTSVVGSDLVMVPDMALLRGAKTVYPVVIDPSTTIGLTRWGYAGSTNATRDDGIARVGADPEGSGIYRSFFAFNLSGLKGKMIFSVKFLTTMTHSWDCASTPVNLWYAAPLTRAGKQTWAGPSLQSQLQEMSGHAHKPVTGKVCSNDPQPDLPMEFTALKLKQSVDAAKGTTNYTLALSTRQADGSSESTSNWWKKFSPTATKLTVEFNTPPNDPTAAQLSVHGDYTAPGQPCVEGASRPTVRSTTPWLKATVTDPDGTNGLSLAGTFSLQRWNGTAWVAVAGWPKTDGGVAPNAKAEVQITSAAASDRFRWQVQTSDTLGGASNWSQWCEFDVDVAPPAVVPTVAPADGVYLESPPKGTNQELRGGLGSSGQFTFGANGVADVFDYVYQLEGGAPMTVRAATLGGSATVWITPTHVGEHVLTVRSRDQAGNSSAPYDYVFQVGKATLPKAVWSMNEGTGNTVATTPVGGPTATLANGARWTETRVLGIHKDTGKDWGVKFDGMDDVATTPGPVIDTAKSFSVAAWARADATTASHVVLSQPGVNKSPFELQYLPSKQRWCFVTYSADDPGAIATANPACASTPVRPGVWTHLAGVYDAGATNQLSLYVNGVREGTGSSPWAWASNGSLTFGAARAGTYAAFFNGAIDDVRVWDRVIDPFLDLQSLVRPVLVGQWEMEDLDEEAPRQVSDESGYQRPATLTDPPAVGWGEGYNFSGGLTMNGTGGSADISDIVLCTDHSFTVSAWVKLGATTQQSILSQDGTAWSAFYLLHDGPSHRWVVTMPSKDASGAVWQAAWGTSVPQVDTWTHLAVVYDDQTRQLRLYVNGHLEGLRDDTTAFAGFSSMHVGRSLGGDYLSGSVDRARVWQGVRSDADIQALSAEP